MKMKINKDLITGASLILMSLLLLIVLIPIGVEIPPGEEIAALSPDFWIKIIVWTLLVLGAVLLLRGIRLSRLGIIEPSSNSNSSVYHPFPKNVSSVTTAIVLLIAYYYAISYLGMIASSILALIIFVRLSGEKRWKITVPIALLLPTSLYFFFLKVAGIPMPLGIFE